MREGEGGVVEGGGGLVEKLVGMAGSGKFSFRRFEAGVDWRGRLWGGRGIGGCEEWGEGT